MFAAIALHNSMTPLIISGDVCFFVEDAGGMRNGCVVLVQDLYESGAQRFTLKTYRSEPEQNADETWPHTKITLWPLNTCPHGSVELKPEDGRYRILGRFVDSTELTPNLEGLRCADLDDCI